ncbi:MAG TPA: hypothetical protein VFK06_24610 [Candidatus Angelobacter sp.]|nr:hypothetical protein [Candidatus Angelobacter sp.]
MPEIYVQYKDDRGVRVQAHAHFQVPADGYLYLVWREGARIERRYLGKPCRDLKKEPEKSTTPAALQQLAGGRRPAPRPRGSHRAL